MAEGLLKPKQLELPIFQPAAKGQGDVVREGRVAARH